MKVTRSADKYKYPCDSLHIQDQQKILPLKNNNNDLDTISLLSVEYFYQLVYKYKIRDAMHK